MIKEGLAYDDVLVIPQKGIVESRKQIKLNTKITRNISIQIPLVSIGMDTVTEAKMAKAIAKLGGLGIIHRFLTIQEQTEMVKEVKKENLLVGAAIGINDDYLERAIELEKSGCDLIAIDVAHAHCTQGILALKKIKEKTKIDVLVGSVATAEAIKDLAEAGADGISIGIGNGTICTTRIVAGAGVPQITAIMDCYEEAKKHKMPIIAQGGTKNSGDIVKAIVAGANAVMIGSQFAGTDEAPGEIIEIDQKLWKSYRGMTATETTQKRKERDQLYQKKEVHKVAEGVSAYVPYKGSVQNIINKIVGGIRSGMSYCGVEKLEDAIGKQNLIKITPQGLKESHPHSVAVKE